MDARPPGPIDPGLPAAFRPPRAGVYDMRGLTFEASPGTVAERAVAPAIPYVPVTPLTRHSLAASEWHPTTSVYRNTNLWRPGRPNGAAGWRVPPAHVPERIEGGRRSHRMRPPPVFPGTATAWPRAVPRWPTFADRARGLLPGDEE